MKTPSLQKILTDFSTEELSGQLFCPAAFIHNDEEGIARIEGLIKDHKIGGITFFHSRASAATNYEKKEVPVYRDSLKKLKALIRHYQSLSEIPLLISIDAEWGLAMRVEETPQYPYAITLGALPEDQDDLIFEAARQMAQDLRSAGIDFNLAPVADINSNPDNPVIGYRSFGANRDKVLAKTSAYCKGLTAGGVLNCLKHFPGHGDTAVDSHLGLPVINRSRENLMQNDLYPFRELIREGVDAVMVGHLAVPALSGDDHTPATLSEKLIKNLLREEFGFGGVVISDALNMHSVSEIYTEKGQLELKAFQAGNDILCFTDHIAEGKAKILAEGNRAQLRESIHRILALKEKAGLFKTTERPQPSSTEVVRKINKQIAEKSIVRHAPAETDKAPVNTLILTGQHQKEKGLVAHLKKSPTFTCIHADPHTHTLTLSSTRELLIAVYPPNIKPMNNFGLTAANLELIDQLLEKHICRLVLFGNPYALRTIPGIHRAKEVVISGQDFEEFQETAASIINGELQAQGVLPFEL